MKRFLTLLATVALVSLAYRSCHAITPTTPTSTPPTIEVHFSPKGGCTEAVVKEIDAAKETILIQAYSFTSTPIAKAILAAHKRGLDIRVILDKSNKTANYSSADFLAHEGVYVWIDSKHAIAHNKVMVIDDATVITGSMNFTRAGETANAENLVVIRDKKIAAQYAENWKEHIQHSDKYVSKRGAEPLTEPAVEPTAKE